MSGKSGPSKRSRQNTNENPYATDVHTYIAEKEEEIKDLQKANEDLKETLKYTKQDLNKSQIENEKLSTYVKELIEIQKTFAEQLQSVQETLCTILTKQNKNENTLESIKDTSLKQAEEVKTQLQQQQQQQQQIKQQLQKQSNEWVQVVRKINKNDVNL